MEHSIDIVIPAYKPGTVFEKLIYRLQKQTVKPERIIVVNTGEEYWEQASLTSLRLYLVHWRESGWNCSYSRKRIRSWWDQKMGGVQISGRICDVYDAGCHAGQISI